MKRKRLFFSGWMILLCFAYLVIFSRCNKYYIVCPETEVLECDTSELISVKAELKECKRVGYWKTKKIDSLSIACHEKDGVIGDTNIFKRMYFGNSGIKTELK